AGGDYHSGNTVYVTNGHHWDVVGHELGHAIYAQAKIGKTAGGSHKIDECYSATLAISEGWASYFSAWLHVSLRDQDAQFEFLVPRRAPLRFEHIPIDVCAGEKNEWRVTGFFWDIIDLSDDGEQSQATFAKVFEYGMKRKFRTTKKYARYLLKKGFDPVLMNIVWENNFLTKF
ncbi:MAG: hypothetical protein HON90_08085, partial [Halobacteriovoraceae bacterium]|nr:hypothetical protein [Halobacteriovoraceae bacterium]